MKAKPLRSVLGFYTAEGEPEAAYHAVREASLRRVFFFRPELAAPLLAGQREFIEKWLRERYPVQAPPAHKPTGPQASAVVGRTRPHRQRSSR